MSETYEQNITEARKIINERGLSSPGVEQILNTMQGIGEKDGSEILAGLASRSKLSKPELLVIAAVGGAGTVADNADEWTKSNHAKQQIKYMNGKKRAASSLDDALAIPVVVAAR